MGINLMIGIHNHQPVGNFGWVFADAFEHSYGPFLEALKRHPEIKITLHNTGPLLDWIEENRPEYLDTLGELVSRGQVEILGGAYYEPIISIIPKVDAAGQIEMMKKHIKNRFGTEVLGMWLAERVWEPTLPQITEPLNIRYTLLDDTHFRYAGLSDIDLFGYYITEYSGHRLCVFPIDKVLRYTIPFRDPKETLSRLKEVSDMRPGAGVVYGDDGEKFGVWPGTYEWVFKDGWLEDFFKTIEDNMNWINLLTFSEYLDRFPPTGRIYLPTASYEEMTEWALPPDAILRYKDVIKRIEAKGMLDDARPFIRGGFFNNFLSKYHESNNMHKRMLYVSKKVNALTKGASDEAKRYLFKAQCNCAYWHGLFGGLYLNYLRHAIYENLSKAEKIADGKKPPSIEILDINADGFDEVLINTPHLSAYISPKGGGSLFHFDLRDFDFCLTNTMSRTFEAYHKEAKDDINEDTQDGPRSIHEGMVIKEEGLFDLFTYDKNPRYSFIDKVFTSPPNINDIIYNRLPDAGDFSDGSYDVSKKTKDKSDISISLLRDGTVLGANGKFPFEIKKVYTICAERPELKVEYTLADRAEKGGAIYFCPELNLTLLGGRDPKRYLLLPGKERFELSGRGEADDVSKFSLVNEYDGFSVEIDLSRPARLLFFGVETASRSEGGLERTYQGSAIIPAFPIKVGGGTRENIEITITISKIEKGVYNEG